ncbi:DUF996 domain-containing protein [Thermococcus camini]|uniref:Uncharacterized membrane protein n=1 Tax=Thermococcus camini TaxID=2016373 RepID=A0A7G2D8Q8_9EURY|nr:DUF996 domain-containing protein [Thermococcus camini]CAD5244009.1 Uncharacterized membrane protein [Thermococcus camini]
MVELRSERNLGIIGSVLVLVGSFTGVIPYWGMVAGGLSLVGEILVLIALKGLGDKLKDDRPFRYYLYSVIATIGIAVIAIIFMAVGIVAMASTGMTFNETPEQVLGALGMGMIFLGLALILAAVVVGIYYAVKTWRVTYELTGVEEFDKTATFIKWGAITAILLVGILLLFVAAIYQIIAFAKLPEELEGKPQTETINAL